MTWMLRNILMSAEGTAGAGGAAAAAPAAAAGAAAPAAAAPAGAGAAAPADWTAGLTPEYKGFIENKGFKDPGSVIDSYRNLEKLMGVPKERLLKLPEKEDDAAAWGEIYDRLGRPKDAKEYSIPMPKEGGDEKFAEWARGAFHEIGIPKKQAEALASKWNEYVSGAAQGSAEAMQAAVAEQEKALKREWGQAYTQNFEMADRAMTKFGISPEDAAGLSKSLSPAQRTTLIKAFAKVGEGMGEHGFVTGGGGRSFDGVMTPAAALDRIAARKGDSDFVRRYTSGDISAMEEMRRLHAMAYPE